MLQKYICYYLLYKLLDDQTLWIISADENLDTLYKRCENFKSNIEEYYIIKRSVKNINKELNIKQFTEFNKNKKDIIIMKTILEK